MAAPVTKLLFLFLLGITSWSRYVAANDVTLIECTVEVPDGNDVIDSWNCGIEDNKLKSNIAVKSNCPGVVQLDIELQKNGQIVNTAGKTIKQPTKDLGDICGEIDGPEPDDDSCSIVEGGFTISSCDIIPLVSDLEPGDYEAFNRLSIDGTDIAKFSLKFKNES